MSECECVCVCLLFASKCLFSLYTPISSQYIMKIHSLVLPNVACMDRACAHALPSLCCKHYAAPYILLCDQQIRDQGLLQWMSGSDHREHSMLSNNQSTVWRGIASRMSATSCYGFFSLFCQLIWAWVKEEIYSYGRSGNDGRVTIGEN